MSALLTSGRGLKPRPDRGPGLIEFPTCPKCDGSGEHTFHQGQRAGEVAKCTRCTNGRMTGKDISRYFAWSTEGYKVVWSRLVVEAATPTGKIRSIRSVNHDTLIFAYRNGAWTPLHERELNFGDWVLIPKKKTCELMVCRLVDVEPVRRRK